MTLRVPYLDGGSPRWVQGGLFFFAVTGIKKTTNAVTLKVPVGRGALRSRMWGAGAEEIASSARARSSWRTSMPRTVTSCHVLPLSAEDYLLIRGDPTYEAYKADLVHQDLHITKLRSGADERADPTRWRSVEVHFRENPVPPFLRSLVDNLVGKEIRLSIAG